jgi:hypothetical protein
MCWELCWNHFIHTKSHVKSDGKKNIQDVRYFKHIRMLEYRIEQDLQPETEFVCDRIQNMPGISENVRQMCTKVEEQQLVQLLWHAISCEEWIKRLNLTCFMIFPVLILSMHESYCLMHALWLATSRLYFQTPNLRQELCLNTGTSFIVFPSGHTSTSGCLWV